MRRRARSFSSLVLSAVDTKEEKDLALLLIGVTQADHANGPLPVRRVETFLHLHVGLAALTKAVHLVKDLLRRVVDAQRGREDCLQIDPRAVRVPSDSAVTGRVLGHRRGAQGQGRGQHRTPSWLRTKKN